MILTDEDKAVSRMNGKDGSRPCLADPSFHI